MPDPAEIRRAVTRLRRDPRLAHAIKAVGPCRYEVHTQGGAFGALMEAIVYQQITGKAGESILRKLRAALGRKHPRPQDFLAAPPALLRSAGLSRQKAGYLRDLAARTQDGLPLRRLSRLDDEAVIEALTCVKGIGRWTAEMFLMFRLGRLDVLPVQDYGIRKAMQRMLSLEGAAGARLDAQDRRALAALPFGGLLVPLARSRRGQSLDQGRGSAASTSATTG